MRGKATEDFGNTKAMIQRPNSQKNVLLALQQDIFARLRLAKAGLCLLLGFSTLFGFLLAEPHLSVTAFLVVAGVISLAGGGATLNSLQDWRQDGQMSRTRNRPLPRGELTNRQAIMQAVVLIGAGLLILAACPSRWPVLLGLISLSLYNGVYTVLKPKTVFAIFPGAICGGLPPIIGWLAAGGQLLSATAGMLFLLLVLWQIPHFWLILLRYREDYINCDFPNMLHELSEQRMKRLFLPWIAALVMAMILITFLPVGVGNMARVPVLASSFLMSIVFCVQLGLRRQANYRLLFIIFNGVFFFNMLVIGGARVLLSHAAGQ